MLDAPRELISDNACGVARDSCQTGLDQSDEVSIGRRAIPRSILSQQPEDLGVRQGPLGIGQDTQDSQAGRGHTQSELAKPLFDVYDGRPHTLDCSRRRGSGRGQNCRSRIPSGAIAQVPSESSVA
jgi:hypothetical protein